MLLYDFDQNDIQKVGDLPFSMKSDNQSYMEQEGTALSLVDTKDRGLCLVRYTVSSNKFDIVAERL